MEALTDDQWERIAPLLPAKRQGRGRPRADDRTTVNGVVWVLRSGARWKDMPQEYGSPATCHRRLRQWEKQGVWERIWVNFLSILEEQGKLDWDHAFLDGSFVPAKKGGRQ